VPIEPLRPVGPLTVVLADVAAAARAAREGGAFFFGVAARAGFFRGGRFFGTVDS
jgi:hypothetical protein